MIPKFTEEAAKEVTKEVFKDGLKTAGKVAAGIFGAAVEAYEIVSLAKGLATDNDAIVKAKEVVWIKLIYI